MDSDSRPSGAEVRALVLAPVGRDGELLVKALVAAGLPADAVATAAQLVDRVSDEVRHDKPPRISALVVTDEALKIEWSRRLADTLDEQPAWSDLPIVMLAGQAVAMSDRNASATTLGLVAERLTSRSSITVLDRPVRVAALVSAVRAAAGARARQAEVRELLAARDAALEEAERAVRVKTEFLAVMSHEIRTPLNAIGGYVQLIELGIHGPLTDAQREALSRINLAQQHVLSIINNLLDYSQIESRRTQYNIERLNLSEVVSEVLLIIESQFSTRSLTYRIVSAEVPVTVMGDADKVRQVLLNLLSNAVKFTLPGGHITIEITETALEEEEFGLVRISDNGIGIPTDKLDAIFDPFVRVHPSRYTEGKRGTGLGLSISREMARGMGGDLTAISSEGTGSSFMLALPLAD